MTRLLEEGIKSQCLSCKKRRVKCDSTLTPCLRCKADGIECPGYQKPLRWNNLVVSGHSNNGVRRMHAIESSGNEHQFTLTINEAPPWSRQDREAAIVRGSVQYYNSELIPGSSPAQLPFKRNAIPADLWHFVPTVLQHTLIVLVRTRQSGKTLSDPSLRPDLCHYRGLSLTGVKALLSDSKLVANDPYGIALMSVLFIMGVDILLCDEHWTIHLEAARRIIALRGGMNNCLEQFANTRGPLLSYLTLDILTATTCNSWLLGATFTKAQLEFINVLPELEQELIRNGHPCPAQILQAVVYTNILRVCCRRPLAPDEIRALIQHDITFERALDKIQSFESNAWARRIATFGRIMPQKPDDALPEKSVGALASFALCCKNAAMLYLLLSCPGAGDYGTQAAAAKATLSRALQEVFDNASQNPNGPLHAQLWKFVCLPLFISAYVKAGWDIGEGSIDADIDRFPAVALALGSRRLLGIAKFMREVREKRANKSSQIWTWDDGFGPRKAII